MAEFIKKPIKIEAVRYGKDEDGRWYPGAVERIARFMLGLDDDQTVKPSEFMHLLAPAPGPAWSPDDGDSDLEMFDEVAHKKWLPLAIGDWVIKGVSGEFYPCKPDIFEQSYATANGPDIEYVSLMMGDKLVGKINFDLETREIDGELFDTGLPELLQESFSEGLMEVGFYGRAAHNAQVTQEKFNSWMRSQPNIDDLL
jgi:hypothetical protein